MIVRRPALNPVTEGLVARLRGDVATQAYLHERPVAPVGTAKRVYAVGAVPEQLDGRWIEIGNPTEGWDVRFMRGGSRLSLLVHLWHTPVAGDDISQSVAGALWGLVAGALSAPLVLAAPHVMLVGVPTLIDIARDSDNRSWHGVVQYAATTRDAT